MTKRTFGRHTFIYKPTGDSIWVSECGKFIIEYRYYDRQWAVLNKDGPLIAYGRTMKAAAHRAFDVLVVHAEKV